MPPKPADRPRPKPKRPPSSLGLRLLAGSALFTVLALVAALFVMQNVLRHFVVGQIDQRLDNEIVALASQLSAAPDGTIHIVGNADGPPFDKPRHNAFWWVAGPTNSLHTGWLTPEDFTPPDAASLARLPAPPPPPLGPDGDMPDLSATDKPLTIEAVGPHDTPMHVRVARRTIGAAPVTIFVAAPVASIAKPMGEAMTTVGFAMGALGIVLLLAAVVQVRLGLRPLGRLRRQIAAVRSGDATAVPVDQPREILPLVTELNSLLDHNAENLVRARRHVANLAHGLKTPLATLSLTVDRMRGDERDPLRDLVAMIERRVRHHLGRARSAALDGASRSQTPLAERLRDLIDVLKRIHADKAIAATLDCAETLAVACEPQDVDEILGNLLDNAFKYTTSLVACVARQEGRTVIVTITDDGPGLRAADIERVMHPGQRIDETVPGFGFGLPIARELAELYGGGLRLDSDGAGLRVTLTLPRAG